MLRFRLDMKLSIEGDSPFYNDLFVLWFYGPVDTIGAFRAWLVYLITLFLGRLSPLRGQPVPVHIHRN